jgi:hypothetical protein
VISQHEFDLDWEGRRCFVQDLGAQQAREVARRIANVIGTAVRQGAGSGGDADVQVAGMVAMGSVLEKLDDSTIEFLTTTFMRKTFIEREAGTEQFLNPKEVSELVFSGGVGLARWFRWMSFCLEITCADFFAAAFAELTKLRSKATKATTTFDPVTASPSPTTSARSGTFTA